MKNAALIVLVALASACSTSKPPMIPINARIALVTNRPSDSKSLDLIAIQIQGAIHATTRVSLLADINEKDYDSVVVLRTRSSAVPVRNHSYDADDMQQTVTNIYPIGYEIRRNGGIVRYGSISVVEPEEFGRAARAREGRYRLQGLNALVRDLAE
jgi:hypothetical protein